MSDWLAVTISAVTQGTVGCCSAATHLYLGDGARVEQRLDKAPDGLEYKGCIDDTYATKHLRVIVLIKLGQHCHEALDFTR